MLTNNGGRATQENEGREAMFESTRRPSRDEHAGSEAATSSVRIVASRQEQQQRKREDQQNQTSDVATGNGRLYRLLDIEPGTTSDRIVANFSQLSLREQFHQAYSILSDEHRKRLYDIGGERIVDHLMSKTWGPMVTVLGSRVSLRLYCLCLFGIAACMTAFFILLALKVDRVVTSITWSNVMIPILILVAGNVVVHVLSFVCSVRVVIPEEESDGVILDRMPSWLNTMSAGLYLAFAAVVTSALPGDLVVGSSSSASITWTKAFSLLIVADGLSLLSSCSWRYPEKVRKSLSQRYRLSKVPLLLCYGFVALVVIYVALSIARWIMIGRKLDGDISDSWYRVFAPIVVRLIFGVLESLLNGVYMRQLRARSGGDIVFTVLGTLFLNALVVVALYMLAADLEGARLISLANILTPMYVFCGYGVIAALFTTVVLLREEGTVEEKERLFRTANPAAAYRDPFSAAITGAASTPAAATTPSFWGTHAPAVPMVGGVPVLMERTGLTPKGGVELVSETDVSDDYLDDGVESLEEVEVDEEPEHYVDEEREAPATARQRVGGARRWRGRGSRWNDHSPFEGTGQYQSAASTTQQDRAAEMGGRMHREVNETLTPTNSMTSSTRRRHQAARHWLQDVHNPYGSTPNRQADSTAPITQSLDASRLGRPAAIAYDQPPPSSRASHYSATSW